MKGRRALREITYMITVQLNKADFEYDIHSLVKAFFPSENVSVSAEKKEPDEPVSAHMDIDFHDRMINVCWKDEAASPPITVAVTTSPGRNCPGDR